LIKSFTRKTSGHCLGTFQTAKLCFGYTPRQTVVSLTTTPLPTFFSLSLSLSTKSLLEIVQRRVEDWREVVWESGVQLSLKTALRRVGSYWQVWDSCQSVRTWARKPRTLVKKCRLIRLRACCSELHSVWISDKAMVTCSYDNVP
jgi:hypothetical protein